MQFFLHFSFIRKKKSGANPKASTRQYRQSAIDYLNNIGANSER